MCKLIKKKKTKNNYQVQSKILSTNTATKAKFSKEFNTPESQFYYFMQRMVYPTKTYTYLRKYQNKF